MAAAAAVEEMPVPLTFEAKLVLPTMTGRSRASACEPEPMLFRTTIVSMSTRGDDGSGDDGSGDDGSGDDGSGDDGSGDDGPFAPVDDNGAASLSGGEGGFLANEDAAAGRPR
jgi:hypothetical protein